MWCLQFTQLLLSFSVSSNNQFSTSVAPGYEFIIGRNNFEHAMSSHCQSSPYPPPGLWYDIWTYFGKWSWKEGFFQQKMANVFFLNSDGKATQHHLVQNYWGDYHNHSETRHIHIQLNHMLLFSLIQILTPCWHTQWVSVELAGSLTTQRISGSTLYDS